MTPSLPRLCDLAPNVLIARCPLCRKLMFAADICQTEGAVAVCEQYNDWAQHEIADESRACAGDGTAHGITTGPLT